MSSFSNKYVYISVPFSGRWVSLNFNLNFMPTRFGRWNGSLLFIWPRIFKKIRPTEKYVKVDKYNPHWWEAGDKKLSKVDFNKIINSAGLKINNKTFHNEFFPYQFHFIY